MNPLTNLTSPDYDLWSVAVMIMEVVAGSDLVLLLKTYEDVQALMVDIGPYMSVALKYLLNEILFFAKDSRAIYNA